MLEGDNSFDNNVAEYAERRVEAASSPQKIGSEHRGGAGDPMVGYLVKSADRRRIQVLRTKRRWREWPHPANRSVAADDRKLTAAEARQGVLAECPQHRCVQVRQHEIVGAEERDVAAACCREAGIERAHDTLID